MSEAVNHAEVIHNFIETSDPLGNSEDAALAALDALMAQLAAKDAELQAAREQALADRGFHTENARLKQELQAAIQRAEGAEAEAKDSRWRVECLSEFSRSNPEFQKWADRQKAERDALQARVGKLEEALQESLPLETFWSDYGRAKSVADRRPISAALASREG